MGWPRSAPETASHQRRGAMRPADMTTTFVRDVGDHAHVVGEQSCGAMPVLPEPSQQSPSDRSECQTQPLGLSMGCKHPRLNTKPQHQPHWCQGHLTYIQS